MARKSRKHPVEPSQDKSAQLYKVAIYARLSSETEANRHRETIETQIEFVNHFVEEHDDMVLVDIYEDRSYSGTDFDRPGFQQMIDDIRSGKINTVCTKDLSRLGRNYLETGNLIERVFPFLDVRYIAITDGYDSETSEGDWSIPLKNMVNE